MDKKHFLMAFLLCGGMMLPGCKNEKATGLNDTL